MRKLPSKGRAESDRAADNSRAARNPEEIRPAEGKAVRQHSALVRQGPAGKPLGDGAVVSSRCFSIIKTAQRANQANWRKQPKSGFPPITGTRALRAVPLGKYRPRTQS